MRATFFHKDIEYALYLDGESWKQGDSLKGTLKLTSHKDDQLELSDQGAFLVLGASKKLKLKDPSGFKVIKKETFDQESKLDGKGSTEISFEFKLDPNCQLTEKSTSLYVACGSESNLTEIGYLPIQVVPFKLLTDFFEIFENFFKFKKKSMKTKKTFVETMMIAPASREFAGFEKLKVLSQIVAENLELSYEFKVKKLDYSSDITAVKSEVIVIKQCLTPKDYEVFAGAVNQDSIIKHIDEALESVRVKPLI